MVTAIVGICGPEAGWSWEEGLGSALSLNLTGDGQVTSGSRWGRQTQQVLSAPRSPTSSRAPLSFFNKYLLSTYYVLGLC